jgi:hypothetical protein
MHRWAGRRSVAGVAVVLFAALAGCGGHSSSPAIHAKPAGARAVLLASVTTTAAAKTARMSMDITASGLGATSEFGVTAAGAIDLGSGDAQFTMHFNGSMSRYVPGGIELCSVGGVVYVQLPDVLGDGKPGGPTWFKIDASKLGARGSSAFGVGGESDPTKFLAYLETVSDGVHNVGSDVVRGVETTHYQASLDLGKAVDRADVPPALRKNLQELLTQSGADAPNIPADVWVDSDGLVRRIRLQLDLGSFLGSAGANGAGTAPSITVSMDLFDFGAPVEVVAPPADRVTDLKDFGMNGGGAIQSPTAAS